MFTNLICFSCDQCPKSFSASNDLEKCKKNVTGDKQISQILPISNVLIKSADVPNSHNVVPEIHNNIFGNIAVEIDNDSDM